MRREIPAPVIAIVANVVSEVETHATLDSLFMYAGAPGDPPASNKQAKAMEWLRRANKTEEIDPMKVLGKVIEQYMDMPSDPTDPMAEFRHKHKEKIARVLAAAELQYVKRGLIAGNVALPSRSLEQIIRDRNLVSVNHEFDRALENVNSNPREAVSAACNILESVCKTYIEDEGLEMPAKQDLSGVWNVVRKHLGFDPSQVGDQDLQQILSGMIGTVSGIGSLRTHTSAAHGAGRKTYRLESRPARLAVHGAHTITAFILESWDKKRGTP